MRVLISQLIRYIFKKKLAGMLVDELELEVLSVDPRFDHPKGTLHSNTKKNNTINLIREQSRVSFYRSKRSLSQNL